MKFKLEPYNRNLSDEDLIKDVKDVAKKIEKETVTIEDYDQFGNYHPRTLQRRFKSWFRVLERAGLKESRSRYNIPDQELFNNIRDVWIRLERQPKKDEMKKPLSKYCNSTYAKRFGSWRKALEAFVKYINDDAIEVMPEAKAPDSNSYGTKNAIIPKITTNRNISDRMRFSILLRDGFRCQSCGRSPLKSPGVELQVDHIIPWSKGGATTPENLQTKCKECNLGKGNAFYK